MSSIALDSLAEIETAIAEAFARIERQRRLISEFHAKGYDVTAPTALLSCLVVNMRTLEERRRGEMRADTVAL